MLRMRKFQKLFLPKVVSLCGALPQTTTGDLIPTLLFYFNCAEGELNYGRKHMMFSDRGSNEAQLRQIADDRRQQRLERAGNIERLVVEVEPGELRPGSEHFIDGRPVLVRQLEVGWSVANERAVLREEAVKVREPLQSDRQARHQAADVVRLEHAFVFHQQLLHRLHMYNVTRNIDNRKRFVTFLFRSRFKVFCINFSAFLIKKMLSKEKYEHTKIERETHS